MSGLTIQRWGSTPTNQSSSPFALALVFNVGENEPMMGSSRITAHFWDNTIEMWINAPNSIDFTQSQIGSTVHVVHAEQNYRIDMMLINVNHPPPNSNIEVIQFIVSKSLEDIGCAKLVPIPMAFNSGIQLMDSPSLLGEGIDVQLMSSFPVSDDRVMTPLSGAPFHYGAINKHTKRTFKCFGVKFSTEHVSGAHYLPASDIPYQIYLQKCENTVQVFIGTRPSKGIIVSQWVNVFADSYITLTIGTILDVQYGDVLPFVWLTNMPFGNNELHIRRLNGRFYFNLGPKKNSLNISNITTRYHYSTQYLSPPVEMAVGTLVRNYIRSNPRINVMFYLDWLIENMMLDSTKLRILTLIKQPDNILALVSLHNMYSMYNGMFIDILSDTFEMLVEMFDLYNVSMNMLWVNYDVMTSIFEVLHYLATDLLRGTHEKFSLEMCLWMAQFGRTDPMKSWQKFIVHPLRYSSFMQHVHDEMSPTMDVVFWNCLDIMMEFLDHNQSTALAPWTPVLEQFFRKMFTTKTVTANQIHTTWQYLVNCGLLDVDISESSAPDTWQATAFCFLMRSEFPFAAFVALPTKLDKFLSGDQTLECAQNILM